MAFAPHLWYLIVIFAAVAIAYSNSFHSGMVFDNEGIIAQDPRIRAATMGNIGQILHGGYWYANPNSGLFRPLTTLSYLVNFAVLGGGLNSTGYHWINLLIHLANAALVYALGVLLTGRARVAFAIGLLWSVHPVLTECVTNIVGRADLLAAFGVLGGLVCYIRAAGKREGKYAWLVLAVLTQAIGVFAKENALILLPLVFWYDMTAAPPAAWRTRIVRYAALATPIAVYWLLRSQTSSHLTVDFVDNPLAGAGFWQAKLTALKVICKMAGLILWPQHLSADYSYNAVPLFGSASGAWDNVQAFVGLGACAAALVLAVRWRRTRAIAAFLIGFLILAAAPTSNLLVTIGALMAERFAYLGAVAFIACLVLLAARLQRSIPAWALPVAASAICLALTARTYARNSDWQDNYSLWSSTVAISPEDARAHNNLGNAVLNMPGFSDADAIREYRIALRVNPDFVEAHYNLGTALLRQPNGPAEALPEFRAALRLRPDYMEAHNELGIVLSRLPGHMPEAIHEFQTAIGESPNYAEAHGNLANAWLQTPGRLDDAIREDRILISLQPQSAQAHYNLANALVGAGKLEEAIAEYKEALKISPDLAEAHYNLAAVLSRIRGREAESNAEFNTAIRLRPDLMKSGR